MYKKNAWEKYNDEKAFNELNSFNKNYMEFISNAKTERECVIEAIKIAKKAGYKDIKEVNSIKPGDKLYATNMGKNICVFKIGKDKLEKGLNILGAHIDSPRIDVKQNPLYERSGFAYLDTHYYGGIVKYQWATIKLALHGVVVKENGEVINVCIGEDENDPVFVITDLLPHLAQDKMQKSAAKAIEGEDLDLTIGSIPFKKDKDSSSVKENIKKILKEKYNIDEEDFVSAELEIVPEGKARELGLDRSMVLGYGHDDRVCAYTSLMAVIDSKDLDRTSVAYLVDKEEIGSVGATGAHSEWFLNLVRELMYLENKENSELNVRRCITNSFMLSSDVSAGYDPLYASVFEDKNASYLGEGLTFNKYTGARGKSGCNDCMPEYMAKVRAIMNNNNIYYQTAELGKVDIGGGGTIAYIMGNMGMNVVDAGVPVMSMHAPYEAVSKVDVYEAYLGYMAFIKDIK